MKIAFKSTLLVSLLAGAGITAHAEGFSLTAVLRQHPCRAASLATPPRQNSSRAALHLTFLACLLKNHWKKVMQPVSS